MKKALLGIDLQYDFCNPQGALSVKGADKDVKNIATFINKHSNDIQSIILSMDSHQPIHIAHQIYWKDKAGNHPELFSIISKADVQSGKWIPQYNQEEVITYLSALEKGGDVCTIWPPHCVIGTNGWSMDETIFAAIEKWSIATGNSYTLVNKGMHQSTEHYSIFKAAVVLNHVDATKLNTNLIDRLEEFDQIFIVGEAADFCVANSLKDLLTHAPQIASKIFILTDCMSYIVEDSKTAENIFEKAKQLGVTFCKSTDIKSL